MWRNHRSGGVVAVAVKSAAKVIPSHGCTCNRYEMYDAMLHRTPITLGGVSCLINGIALEDGSGHNFNVTVLVGRDTHTVYVKG